MIFKNINSEDISGLIICSEPPISSSAIRTKETTIDGRDGAIVEKLGYKTRIRNVEIGLKKDANVDKILSYFSGEGDLIFKNENDKVYKAAIYEQVDLERLLRLRKGSVAFYCQPFKYKRNDIFETIKDNKVKEKKGKHLELLNCAEQNVVDLKLEGSTKQATRSGKNLLKDNFAMTGGGTTTPTVTTLTGQSTPKGLGIVRKITIPANNDNTFYSGCRAVTPSVVISSINNTNTISARIWIKTSMIFNTDYKIFCTGYFGTQLFVANTSLNVGDWKCFELDSYVYESSEGRSEFICIHMASTSESEREILVAEAQINDGALQGWEQYGASPSPDYPSPIENVEGNIEIKVTNGLEETDENYQEQVVTFPLSEGQKLMEGSYLADDGIHHKRKQIVLKGTETWGKDPNTEGKTDYFYIKNIGITENNINNVFCTHFVKGAQYTQGFWATTVFCITINKEYTGIVSTDTRDERIAKFKNWLAEQYANGTPVIIEYELSEEEIVPYTTAQQEAYNQLQKLKLYKGQNTMFSLEGSIINLKYLEDTDEKVENQGNIYSKPIIRLEKTVFKEVEIAINGIRFKYNFEEDDYVEIDCEEMTVQYEGLDRNRRLVIDFEFPKLKEGNNDIVMYSGDCIIKCKRKDRWL